MTIDTNIDGEFQEGIFFQWIDGCNEYAADAFNYDEFTKTNDIYASILFTYTDVPSLENIVFNLVTHYKLDVDLFENCVIKDAFLMTLRLLLAEGQIDENIAKHAKEWYLSDNPGFKVLKVEE